MTSPAFVTASLFCPDCEDWHSIRVIVHEGNLPECISVGSGAGAGWLYSLTGEDRGGAAEGLSIPVYRALCSNAKALEMAARSGLN